MWSYNDSAKNSRVWALECERKSVGKSPGIGIPNGRSEEWRQNTYAPTIHWVVVFLATPFSKVKSITVLAELADFPSGHVIVCGIRSSIIFLPCRLNSACFGALIHLDTSL